MEKKYSLTKNEIDVIGNLLSVARSQEEILNAITVTYKVTMLETVFKRLGIDPNEFVNTAVNLSAGELILKEQPPEKPEEAKPVEPVIKVQPSEIPQDEPVKQEGNPK